MRKTLLLIALASFAITSFIYIHNWTNGHELHKMKIFLPFVFSKTNDPTNIFTVGDQVLAEHLYSFHARSTTKSGFEGFASNVVIDGARKTVTIIPKTKIARADGTTVSVEDICAGLDRSLKGTTHAPYGAMVKSIYCKGDGRISVEFSELPVNLRFLFTLPDYSIFDANAGPLTAANGKKACGPYYLVSLNATRAELKRNPFYPDSLTANKVEDVVFQTYSSSESEDFINNLDPKEQDAAYFFGHSLVKEDLAKIERKGFVSDVAPMEWLSYLMTGANTSPALKSALADEIESYQKSDEFLQTFGVAAYGLAPQDREYSISSTELKILRNHSFKGEYQKTKFTLATLRTWAKLPPFKRLIARLKSRFPEMDLVLIEPTEMIRLFNSDYDIALGMVGMSAADPLSHLSFMANTMRGFDKVINTGDITRAAAMSDSKQFVSTIRDYEMRIARSGIILPIAHFPGITIHRADLTVDENLSFGWGIQAWSFHVD